MDIWFIRELVMNVTMLVCASILYGYVYEKYWKETEKMNILIGLIGGVVGILLFANAARLYPGIFIDARTVLVSTTGMFFGPAPAAIACIMIGTVRLLIGGPGAWVGVLMLASSFLFGLLWRRFRYRPVMEKRRRVFQEFYAFGLFTHMIMILCMLILPRDIFLDVIAKTWLPVMLLLPIGTLLVSMVLWGQLRKIKTETELQESETRLRTLYEQAPVGITAEDGNGIIYCNTMYEQIVGRSKDEVNEKGWLAYVHPDDLEKSLENHRAFCAGEVSEYNINVRLLKQDGTVVWVNVIVVSLNTGETAREHLCMIRDITETVQVKEKLEDSLNKYRELYHEYKNKQSIMVSLINSTKDIIFYKDRNHRFLGCNKAYEEFAGRKEAEIIGYGNYDIINKELAEKVEESDDWVVQQNMPHLVERSHVYPDGREILVEILKSPYYDEKGNILGVVGIGRDITERKIREKVIEYLNYHDILTGVYNRAYYEQERHRLEAVEYLPISTILADVDGLKLVNDAFGHAEGDQLLVRIANIFKSCCRETDIITRMGGDEFCIFMPNTDNETARDICDKIETAIKAYAARPDGIDYTSVSVGCATLEREGESLEEVLKIAEEYMYRHKLLSRKGLHSTILTSIKTTLFEKSNETQEHAERMAALSIKLGKQLGLHKHDLDVLELAANLHDIGKISIDLSILKKPGKLTLEEEAQVRKHPEAGYRIAHSVPELRPIAEIILHHHERWDGRGYPQGLSGTEIPLLSRIIALVDSYDAMSETRDYHQAMTKEEAAGEIMRSAGSHFDPHLARVFVEKVLGRKID